MKKILLLVLLTSIMTYAQAGNVAKAPIASPTFTGTVTIPTLNITSAFKIGGTTVTPSVTELNYVDGVTSAIQTQFTNITDSTAALRTDINTNATAINGIVTGSGFLANGAQSSVVAALTWSTGTSYGLVFNDGNKLTLPYFSNPATISSYSLGYGPLGSMYFGTKKLATQTDVDSLATNIVKAKVNYEVNIPRTSAGGSITHVYIDSTYNRYYINMTVSTTVYFYNPIDYVFEIRVANGSSYTLSFAGADDYDLIWIDNPPSYTFVDPGNGDAKYVFEVWTNTSEIFARRVW